MGSYRLLTDAHRGHSADQRTARSMGARYATSEGARDCSRLGDHPASKEADRDEAVTAQPVSKASQRRALVDNSLRQCQSETSIKLNRKHIWRAAGHTTPRQFEYWQAGEDRVPGSTRGATDQDDLNFRRVLGTSPREFVAQLEKLGLIVKI